MILLRLGNIYRSVSHPVHVGGEAPFSSIMDHGQDFCGGGEGLEAESCQCRGANNFSQDSALGFLMQVLMSKSQQKPNKALNLSLLVSQKLLSRPEPFTGTFCCLPLFFFCTSVGNSMNVISFN